MENVQQSTVSDQNLLNLARFSPKRETSYFEYFLSAAILMVVEDLVYNICDQRFHEFEINRLYPNITVIRKTLTELITCSELNADRKLIV